MLLSYREKSGSTLSDTEKVWKVGILNRVIRKDLSVKLKCEYKSEGNKITNYIVSCRTNSPVKKSIKYKYYETEKCVKNMKETSVSEAEDMRKVK